MSWLPAAGDVLAFARDPGFRCVVNAGEHPAELPAAVRGARLLLASAPLTGDGTLPPDTAAWYLE
jgi:alpha-glucosidase